MVILQYNICPGGKSCISNGCLKGLASCSWLGLPGDDVWNGIGHMVSLAQLNACYLAIKVCMCISIV